MSRKEDRLDRVERTLEEISAQFKRQGLTFLYFAESLLAPSLPRVMRRFGIDLNGYRCRVSHHINGDTMEVDVVGVGKRGNRQDVVVAVEVKSFLQADDVLEWLKKIPRFRDFFKEYRRYELIGGVAGITLGDGVVEYAEKHGLVVLGPGEDIAAVLNHPGFKPRIYPAARGQSSE
jgi:hypothetical protein